MSKVYPYQTAQSHVELLTMWAAIKPDQIAFTYLEDGERPTKTLTYAELHQRAKAIAARLQNSAESNARALLLYPNSLDYIEAFYGCLYAGVWAVPIYPPHKNRPITRFQAVAMDADTTIALTTNRILSQLKTRFDQDPYLTEFEWIASNKVENQTANTFKPTQITQESIAFLQYTSGSTSTPKGVMVSHGNLLKNHEMLRHSFVADENSVYVSWLPLFHDMGLIGNVLQNVFMGTHCVVMDPVDFIRKPIRWLQAISDFGGTISGAPNFAYDLCNRKVSAEQRKSLNLSTWKVAFNGAEPVRPHTTRKFIKLFAESGLAPTAPLPCYGLAEATLFVTGGTVGEAPIISKVNSTALNENGHLSAATTPENQTTLVGCGRSWLTQQIIIADPQTQQKLPDDYVGEIWIGGPHIAQGYWRKPDISEEIFQARLADTNEGPFMRTGDLGFLRNGELYITGRQKDLIIIRGRNYYPQDIELTVDRCHPAIRPGRGAAFTIPIKNEERLVVVQEVSIKPDVKIDPNEVVERIRTAIASDHGLRLHAVQFIKGGSVPKTSSGKIQRRASRHGFLNGRLAELFTWREKLVSDAANHNENSVQLKQTHSQKAIQQWLRSAIAEQLDVDPNAISISEPLALYGLESVHAIAISAELETFLGQPVLPTLVYDYPTIYAIAAHFAPADQVAEKTHSPNQTVDEIAVVGMACRFPRANNIDQFWQILEDGADAIREVPQDRWPINDFYADQPGTNGKMVTRWGGFIDNVDQFDADFFGISPREAESMDPQQRLLLEISWNALEHAGIDSTSLRETKTGVFVGISHSEYNHLLEPNAYFGTGQALSVAANRLSYFLDLRGPSMAVDTACSSSLVALHLACQSLRHGDCDTALASGVNLILQPDMTIAFSQARMMANDGRCKTFDDSANGYVRSEGCGVVVLKPLAKAVADGDNILAVIKGSAINQDGRSNGLTAPNGPAQQQVIRDALKNAGVAAHEIGYVEAHGTGTSLGDPIEFNSLQQILSQGRDANQHCKVGSVKTNIGHLEAAAGIAGFIKVVLSLANEKIPANLHFNQLNKHIQFDSERFEIPTDTQAWLRGAIARVAGVSSFGFGGANAHIIVGEAPSKPAIKQPRKLPMLLPLSARDGAAVGQLADSYQKMLAGQPDDALADSCLSAASGRAHFNHRAALVVADVEALRSDLLLLSQGKTPSYQHSGQKSLGVDRPIIFMFTGQGSQANLMGQRLYEIHPVFRAEFDRCCALFDKYCAEPLRDTVFGETDERINQTAFTQPALFALEYALAKLLQSWGLEPSLLIGHSIGELVAACIAGVFTLEDGCKLVAHRGKLMQTLPTNGAMLSVTAPESDLKSFVAPFESTVSIAAVNGPKAIVFSGLSADIQTIQNQLEQHGIKTKPLTVSHAFHSPLMEPMLVRFSAIAQEISYHEPQIDIISNVTGLPISTQMATPDYWVEHVRQAVRFADGVAQIPENAVVIEIGPHPVLTALGKQMDSAETRTWIPTLRRRQDDWRQLLNAVAAAYTSGCDINWQAFASAFDYQRVQLPTYPWQHQRYWIDTKPEKPKRAAGAAPSNPLLGVALEKRAHQPNDFAWQFEFSPAGLSYFDSHRINQMPVLPVSAYVEMALGAALEALPNKSVRVEDLALHAPLFLNQAQTVQLTLSAENQAQAEFSVYARSAETDQWIRHASAKLKSTNT